MKGKALLAVIGVFLLGLVGGAFLDQLYSRQDDWGGWRVGLDFADKRSDRKSRRKNSKQYFIHILSQELGLSEEQRERIRPMLDRAREKLYETRLASIAQYDQIVLDLGKSIRSSLNPEQMEKLDQLTERFQERRTRKRERLRTSLRQLRASQ